MVKGQVSPTTHYAETVYVFEGSVSRWAFYRSNLLSEYMENTSMRHTDKQLQQIACLTNKQFKAKYKRKTQKKWTKRQKQQWWLSLSAEEKAAFIDKKVDEKSQKRQLKMLRIMKEDTLEFDCKKCIHWLSHSCTDNLKDGCTYYYNAKTDEHGPAYAA